MTNAQLIVLGFAGAYAFGFVIVWLMGYRYARRQKVQTEWKECAKYWQRNYEDLEKTVQELENELDELVETKGWAIIEDGEVVAWEKYPIMGDAMIDCMENAEVAPYMMEARFEPCYGGIDDERS